MPDKMETNENDQQLIIQYLDNTCNLDQQALVEEKLVSSATFLREFIQMDGIIAALKAVEKAKQIDKINELYSPFIEQENIKIRRVNSYLYFAVAATITLLIVGYFTFIKIDNYESLYDSYYQAYKPSIQARSTDKAEQDAFKLYESKNFEASILLLEKIVSNRAVDGTYLMLGTAYMETGQLIKAKEILEKANEGNGLLSREASWLLAMIYIKESNTNELKSVLQHLKNTDGLYNSEAVELLERIDN